MPQLPANVVAGRTTPTFDAVTVPAALRQAHHTSVWAELVVESGSVLFVDETSGSQTTVTSGERQVIVPERKHHIEPDASARFRVQFYAVADQA